MGVDSNPGDFLSQPPDSNLLASATSSIGLQPTSDGLQPRARRDHRILHIPSRPCLVLGCHQTPSSQLGGEAKGLVDCELKEEGVVLMRTCVLKIDVLKEVISPVSQKI